MQQGASSELMLARARIERAEFIKGLLHVVISGLHGRLCLESLAEAQSSVQQGLCLNLSAPISCSVQGAALAPLHNGTQ